MNNEPKRKKKPASEKKNPASHQAWLEYKKERNRRNKLNERGTTDHN